MKTITSVALFILFSSSLFGQQDTIAVTKRELADSIYGLINTTNMPSGRLFNRQFRPTTESTLFHFSKDSISTQDTIKPDYIYSSLLELKEISINPGLETDAWDLFDSVQKFCLEEEFDNNRVIVPITFIDKIYHYYDDSTAISNETIVLNSENKFDETNNSIVQVFDEKRIRLAGPLYDFMSAEVYYFYVKRDWLVVDSIDKIDHFSIGLGDFWYELPFDTYLPIKAPRELAFNFKIRVHYKNELQQKDAMDWVIEFLAQYSNLTLMDLPINKKICNEDNQIAHGNNKLQWCLVHGCTTDQFEAEKPFILLTGYRPPILSQSFDKTYSNYSTYHNALLELLRNKHAFDVYLVRFNIHSQTQTHGIVESAKLLKDFIHYVNERKAGVSSMGAYNENVIMASSMSCDVARLGLLMMEKEHAQGANHHHTRLFISYDGNFYGANIPLASQAMLYSNKSVPKPITVNQELLMYMYSAMKQKTTKQLLAYHIATANENPYDNPFFDISKVASPNQERINFLSFLNSYDNGVHSTPMPNKIRQVGISLGKISGTNDENVPSGLDFNGEGENWVDLNNLLEKYILRSAKYTTSGEYFKLFHRDLIICPTCFLGIPIPYSVVKERLHVSQMQEVDNAGGSYLPGAGNILAISNLVMFGGFQKKIQFSHKSVATALAINPTLWPGDGSLRVNVQDLGLMKTRKKIDGTFIQSNYHGYPHLGRPADYRDITPFDAIYIDNKINPHINLQDDDAADSDSLRDFLLNEIEPDYLFLQNFELGSQARPDYTYRAKRRAKVAIYVGDSITPSTPYGPFRLAPNADLVLVAGDYLEIDGYFETEFGSQFTASTEYEYCNPNKMGSSDGSAADYGEGTITDSTDDENQRQEAMERDELSMYPNPTNGQFQLISNHLIKTVTCYSMTGIRIFETEPNSENWESEQQLAPGTYIIRCLINNRWQQQKLVVL
ncbi:T9SS type A sorting domain-containing protein [Fluviicola taffensis]|uniref:Uncharacterized protein n=1 Tax=Fluviicola taffensis (strain DSM 16823 / NCIMB 13979 / RW262) TaxID=755732 RepID=F2IGM4_FLUTR|nr:T9SS type A sorting domain-containing protein [Fluviicola taffensis]AEA43641.1 hypothetical protein Fluta_1649 [Fluviicola taffensis DSM 16823]